MAIAEGLDQPPLSEEDRLPLEGAVVEVETLPAAAVERVPSTRPVTDEATEAQRAAPGQGHWQVLPAPDKNSQTRPPLHHQIPEVLVV